MADDRLGGISIIVTAVYIRFSGSGDPLKQILQRDVFPLQDIKGCLLSLRRTTHSILRLFAYLAKICREKGAAQW
jgi:hypothetical protein